TKSLNEYLVATGDKRSQRALATAPGCESICDRMAGNVICLEQTIVRLIDAIGFETVLERIVPVRECDTAIKAAFGSGLRAENNNVLLSLSARIKELRAETGSLLIDR
ncbi:MAG: hypothetical protein ACLQVD_11430, partial [Capsulimonadaceae bacterium]